MKIKVPDLSLVVLVGATSSGKTSFAHKYFNNTEIVSSDYCRSILTDDENCKSANEEVFDLLYTIVSKRLKLGRLTVVDATNIDLFARKKLIKIPIEIRITGRIVDFIPTVSPWIILGPWPDWEARAIDLTWEYFLEVKKLVIINIPAAIKSPNIAER